MKVACVQMDVLHCRKQENLEKALYMALEAVRKGAEIIVFPEVFSTGFCYENFDHLAENLPSPTLENLACFSEANDCVLIGSVIQKETEEKQKNTEEKQKNTEEKQKDTEEKQKDTEEKQKEAEKKKNDAEEKQREPEKKKNDTHKNNLAKNKNSFEEKANSFAGKEKEMPESKNDLNSELYNSSLYYNLGFCFDSGSLAGTYRKTHPFKNENQYFSRGNSLEPITLKKRNLKIGFEICYELRFPEVARKLVLAGSDLLVTAAAFPNPRSEHWKTLARARAIENQIPHIACNRIGAAPDCSYFGNSMIIDAWGEVKADAGNRECVIVYDLDLSGKDEIRKMIPVFEDRRTELYSNS